MNSRASMLQKVGTFLQLADTPIQSAYNTRNIVRAKPPLKLIAN